VTQRPGELVIEQRWLGLETFLLAAFALFWNGFLVVWFRIAFSEGFWPMAAFGSLHAAVGVVLAYYVLCSFANTTRIRVGSGRLGVEHGPLPWVGQRDLASGAVEQLYCVRKQGSNERRSGSSFTVKALLGDGRALSLVSGLLDAEQALFIEKAVERELGIDDRPVVGEIPR
jgi:hypothetical protein